MDLSGVAGWRFWLLNCKAFRSCYLKNFGYLAGNIITLSLEKLAGWKT